MPSRFPLSLSAGKRYLVDQFGVPFLGLGDSPWEMATTLSLTDADTFLADRQSRGFNTILLECIDNIFNANGTGANANGDLPFTTVQGGGTYNNSTTQNPDFSTPLAAYWTHLDAILNLCVSRNFLIFLYPAWIGNPVGGPSTEGYYNALNAQSSTIRQNYGKFLANRYGPSGSNPVPNIIWGIGGDNNPVNTAVNTDIVTGIQSIITSPAPLFFVDGLDGDSMINRWGGDSFFSVNGIYSDSLLGHPWMYQQCQSEYQNSSGLEPFYPQFMKEGGYEFGQAGWTEQFVRGQNWQAMLSGCWGYCLGIDGLWQFSPGWQSLLGSTATLGAQVLNNFFSQRDWYNLVPDFTTAAFLTNSGSYSDATFASAASTTRWGAIYVPTNELLVVSMSGFVAPVGAWWVDPTNGRKKQFLGMFSNSGSHSFASTPGTNAGGDNDWVLLLEPPSNCTYYNAD